MLAKEAEDIKNEKDNQNRNSGDEIRQSLRQSRQSKSKSSKINDSNKNKSNKNKSKTKSIGKISNNEENIVDQPEFQLDD